MGVIAKIVSSLVAVYAGAYVAKDMFLGEIIDLKKKKLKLKEDVYNQQKYRDEQELKMLRARMKHMKVPTEWYCDENENENHQQPETAPENKIE